MNSGAAFPVTVVIVDNEADLCEVIRLTLIDEGYSATSCTDPSAALGMIVDEQPACVIADWQLFDPATGMRIFDALRSDERTAGLAILICSAAFDADEIQDGIADERTAFLAKPFELDDLIHIVRRITG